MENDYKKLFLNKYAFGNCRKTLKKKETVLKLIFEYFLNIKLENISKEDVTLFLRLYEGRWSEHHYQYIRRITKAFFQEFKGKDFVQFIKVKRIWSKLKREDLLTIEEISNMIDASPLLRDKVIISLLYDGALRHEELRNLQLKDIDKLNNIWHLHLHGVKGERIIPLTFSIIYVEKYLGMNELGMNELLFKVGATGIRNIIKRSAFKASINKRVYPYLIRHSRLTELANYLSEMQLKRFAGWEYDSPMIRNYVHLGIKDLDHVLINLPLRL